MSGLVAYDSSSSSNSGEDQKPQPSESQRVVNDDQVSGGSNHSKIDRSKNPGHSNEEGSSPSEPILGPLMPSTGNGRVHYDNTERGEPVEMSDRDTIRFLTQATHPMVEMPPSPPGSPDPNTTARFRKYQQLKATGVHFNEDLASKNAFKNPSLLTMLMTKAGVEGDTQYSSSLPSKCFNTSQFPDFAYKEELLKSQKTLHAQEQLNRKVQSAAGKRSIDFVPG